MYRRASPTNCSRATFRRSDQNDPAGISAWAVARLFFSNNSASQIGGSIRVPSV
ncbi:MAG TPA: hypothetical protein DDX19_07365 [Rhodopirellula baltica]|nr:hypothetical protein [Rhodopirellula baltica]